MKKTDIKQGEVYAVSLHGASEYAQEQAVLARVEEVGLEREGLGHDGRVSYRYTAQDGVRVTVVEERDGWLGQTKVIPSRQVFHDEGTEQAKRAKDQETERALAAKSATIMEVGERLHRLGINANVNAKGWTGFGTPEKPRITLDADAAAALDKLLRENGVV